MAKIWFVAKRELMAFFTTWTGYVVIFSALLLDGLFFNAFAIGSEPRMSAEVLYQFFYFSSGLVMVASIFLAIRLISEEAANGTLILFLTSPVSERQYIYGKFISCAVVLLILQVLSLYLPLLILVEGKVSLGHLFSGYLGTTLLGLAVLSISLFSSSITSSQLLSGVVAAALVVIFLLLWLLAAVVDEPLRSLFSYLAIHNDHFRRFGRGVIHTKHFVYYASLIIFFLECSIRSLETRRLEG